jgi:hypothetical protein
MRDIPTRFPALGLRATPRISIIQIFGSVDPQWHIDAAATP